MTEYHYSTDREALAGAQAASTLDLNWRLTSVWRPDPFDTWDKGIKEKTYLLETWEDEDDE